MPRNKFATTLRYMTLLNYKVRAATKRFGADHSVLARACDTSRSNRVGKASVARGAHDSQ